MGSSKSARTGVSASRGAPPSPVIGVWSVVDWLPGRVTVEGVVRGVGTKSVARPASINAAMISIPRDVVMVTLRWPAMSTE